MNPGSTLGQAMVTSCGGGDMAESGSEVEMDRDPLSGPVCQPGVRGGDGRDTLSGPICQPGVRGQQGHHAIRGWDRMCGRKD